MTPDELKTMPKGSFIVAKTGVHPMKVRLRLFLDWGIRFGKPYEVPERVQRPVAYASKQELEDAILLRHHAPQVGDTMEEKQASESATNGGSLRQMAEHPLPLWSMRKRIKPLSGSERGETINDKFSSYLFF